MGVPLLLLLVVVPLLWTIAPRTAQAVSLDFVAGICAAIIGVWAVGGLFEFSGKLFDVGVKAAGGVAIMLIIVLWLRPYYASGSVVVHAVEVNFPAGETLDFALDVVDGERRAGTSAIRVDYSGQRDDIGRLQAPDWVQGETYAGGSWFEVLGKIADDLPCLSLSGSTQDIVLRVKADATAADGAILRCK